MGLADDFLTLPNGLKLLIGFVIILGASIEFPIINVSVGQVLFAPFTIALNFLGLYFTWELFVILYGLILVAYYVHWVLKFLPSNSSSRR